MFLTASSLIYERLYLITLGSTCRYAVVSEDDSLTLTDPGASVHVHALQERLSRLKLSLSSLKNVLVTHLDADRIAGIPLLRRINPKVKVFGTAAMHTTLSDSTFVKELYERDLLISSWFSGATQEENLSFNDFKAGLKFDKLIAEGDSICIDEDVSVRCLTTPGHRPHSVAYLVVPHAFAIVDETFGYYRGRNLTAPGGDTSIHEALVSVGKFKNIELNGIGFSYGGAITGSLTKRHIELLIQNTKDLATEVAKARKEGFSEQEIEEQVRASFYSATSSDPCLNESLLETNAAVMRQLQRATS
jgi:glyoxylase-like metal-dependent hydrolase (beta-lactamase superfamily II)